MKVRLNKKTKDELSIDPVLSTLGTKQQNIENNISMYLDEPFLKPENIRHGITMAGVDGKYADVKTVEIYDMAANKIRTLASTEPTPLLTAIRDDDAFILTNAPFDPQQSFNLASSLGYSYNKLLLCDYYSNWIVNAQVENYPLADRNTKVICVPENYQVGPIAVTIEGFGASPSVTFYDDAAADYYTTPLPGTGLKKYQFNGVEKSSNCVIDVIDATLPYNFGEYTGDEFIDGIKIDSWGTGYENVNPDGSLSTLFDVYVTFNMSLVKANTPYAIRLIDRYGETYDICISTEGYPSDSSFYPDTVGDGAYGNYIELSDHFSTIYFQFLANDERGPYTIHASAANTVVDTTGDGELLAVLMKHFKNKGSRYYPYYIELPTKITDHSMGNLTFDETVSIGDTSKMHILHNANSDQFDAYIEALEAAAILRPQKVSDVYFGDSHIVVYETLSQRICVQLLYFDYYGATDKIENHYELRVIEDSRTGEFDRLSFSNIGISELESNFADSFDNSAFMMLYDDTGSLTTPTDGTKRYPGGMGFVFRLSDGSFFIIDGGFGGSSDYFTEYKSMARNLFNALQVYNNGNPIRIAGWLITHLHQDHIGIFCEFIENSEYKSQVSIDKVIYGLPPEYFSCMQAAPAQSYLADFEAAVNVLRAEGKTEIIKAHMGQVIDFSNLRLTILSATEDVYKSYDPSTGTMNNNVSNLNDTSVICKVHYCGKDLVFMADASKQQINSVVIPVLTNQLSRVAGFQVAHHGYVDTDSDKLYAHLANNATFDPEFVLWPVCYEHFSGKNLDGSIYKEDGAAYSSLYQHSKNAALTVFNIVYPVNNYSMLSTPQNFDLWYFEPVSFVASCQQCGRSNANYSTDWDGIVRYFCNESCANDYYSEHFGSNEPTGYNCSYPGCENIGDLPSTDYDGTLRYYCCDEHYNNYCNEHGIYYGLGDCPYCGSGGDTTPKCWYCSNEAVSSIELDSSTYVYYCADHYPDYCAEHKTYGLASEGWYCSECHDGVMCSYPGCGTVADLNSTDWDGTTRYYCCDEHYNQYCNIHGIYYGLEGTRCPECGVASCKYCGEDENNTDMPALERCPTCQEYFHYICGSTVMVDDTYYCSEECTPGYGGEDTLHSYCSCGRGIYGADDYSYCNTCHTMYCVDCASSWSNGICDTCGGGNYN